MTHLIDCLTIVCLSFHLSALDVLYNLQSVLLSPMDFEY